MENRSSYNRLYFFFIEYVIVPIWSFIRFLLSVFQFFFLALSGNIISAIILTILWINFPATISHFIYSFFLIIASIFTAAAFLWNIMACRFGDEDKVWKKEPNFMKIFLTKMKEVFNQFMIDVSKTTEERQAMREAMREKSRKKREARKAEKLAELEEANRIKHRAEILDIR